MNENENDLREALRTTMTLVAEPPPMASAAALAAGRRAVRRRVALTGVGATAAVAAVAALAVGPGMQLVSGSNGDAPWAGPGQPSAEVSAVPAPGATGQTPGPEDTKPVWPMDGNGQPQTDATSRSGPHFNQGKKVLEGVLAGVPDGYTTPTGNTSDEIPLRDHEASIEGTSWRYAGSAAIAKSGGTGRLIADVHTPGDNTPADACGIGATLGVEGGECTTRTVAGKEVAVLTSGTQSWHNVVAYRYDDGTIVSVGQSLTASNGSGNPAPLAEPALTVEELAALATDPRFHLN
ncbi:MAG: hypothetical protein ABW000_17795 [Actinoplanes sp.]